MENENLWGDVLERLKVRTTRSVYFNLMEPCQGQHDGNGHMAIYAPDESTKLKLENLFQPVIRDALKSLGHPDIKLSFELKPEEEPEQDGPLVEIDELIADHLEQQNEQFAPAYSMRAGQMIYTTYKTYDGQIVSQERIVAPFTARITEKLTIYDTEQQVIYKVRGRKGGRPFKAELTADDWADPKKLVSMLLRYLPGKPPATDPAMRRHWGPAIASLTDESDMKEVKALNSTGWTPDGRAFVMPAGTYGKGYVCQLEPGLYYELSSFGLTKRKKEENQKTVFLLLYGLPKIFRQSVIYTALAHAFLAPLLDFVGNEARYLYHIYANTGSFKTELAKIIMALFGPVGTQAITYKWSNTPYGAESRAHALKDVLMVIDDLKPGTINEADQSKWVAFIQAAVDAQGRRRATIGGRASAALAPRALLLSTGEAIPEAGEASYTARMLLAELDRQPAAGRNRILDIIRDKSVLFSGLMYEYIAWLQAGKGRDALNEFKAIQEKSLATAHARLASNYAANRLGAVMLAKFCLANGMLSPAQHQKFLDDHHAGLLEIVVRTGEKAESERYSARFMEALHDALATGFAGLSDSKIENRVGWRSDKFICLLNGAKDIVDQWLRNSGQTPINIAKSDLRHQLFDDGLLHTTQARVNKNCFDVQILDPMTGSYQMVTAVHLDRFYKYNNG